MISGTIGHASADHHLDVTVVIEVDNGAFHCANVYDPGRGVQFERDVFFSTTFPSRE